MCGYKKELEKVVANAVDESRFIHIIGVRDISFSLAIVYGAEREDALIAGLLHDLAKCLSNETLIEECKKYNLEITEDEYKSPYLLHGKLGAFYSKRDHGVENPDILNAIIYHTTGRANMSLLEKIVFVADYIEPGRMSANISNMSQIQKIAYQNIDKAVAMILKNTIEYLTNKGVSIDNISYEAYEFYSKNLD